MRSVIANTIMCSCKMDHAWFRVRHICAPARWTMSCISFHGIWDVFWRLPAGISSLFALGNNFWFQFCYLGIVTSLELNHKPVEKATKGQEVCIKIENVPGETPKLYGRHFDETDSLVSKVWFPLFLTCPVVWFASWFVYVCLRSSIR